MIFWLFSGNHVGKINADQMIFLSIELHVILAGCIFVENFHVKNAKISHFFPNQNYEIQMVDGEKVFFIAYLKANC